MRSGRMARRLVATAGMGAIIAMGVLSACAKEQKAPEPTTPKHTDGYVAGRVSASRRPDRRRRLPATYPATSRTRQACSHVPWRQLTPDWSIRSSRSRRHRNAVPAVAKDATWPMAMLSADCMSLGSRPVWESR